MVQFQKLTRNLFLTLHGHNVHRQQRQLSKFLVRYQHICTPQNGAHRKHFPAATPFLKLAPKTFSCCDAILETDPAVSMRSELLVAHEKLGQLPLLTVYVVPV
jgi:hypothetical protein